MKPHKETLKSAKSATVSGNGPKRFTDEERIAMRERAEELDAEQRVPSAKRTGGEDDVLAKIAEMPESDRSIAERLHAIIKASAPTLSPKTWYGMPAYAKNGNVVSFKVRTSLRRDTRRSASATKRTSSKERCGPSHLR